MNQKIQSFAMKNFAQLREVSCSETGNINLFIGENGTGKSTLLKALYAAVRSIETWQRGNDARALPDLLGENLRWTFQVDKLGDLVSKSANAPLEFTAVFGEDTLSFSFGSSTTTQISSGYTGKNQPGNSVFIPAREILSLRNQILKSRQIDQSFGFDNPSYDLARALGFSAERPAAMAKADEKLTELIGGRVVYEEQSGKWFYKKGNTKYSIHTTSDGIKKVAMLERLLANGYLNEQSILFFDEPESSLHPKAISTLLEVVDTLANDLGIQVFLASHSYFVINKLRILALRRNQSIPCISLSPEAVQYDDLKDGMPVNSIIQESVRLYEEEVDEVMK